MKEYNATIRFMMTMSISCILAVLVGNWLDELLHTSPWILLVLLAYAIGGNLYVLIRSAGEEDE